MKPFAQAWRLPLQSFLGTEEIAHESSTVHQRGASPGLSRCDASDCLLLDGHGP